VTTLQQQIGNQAVQRILAKPNGQGSLKLDRETALRLIREHSPLAPFIANQAAARGGQVQRQVETEGPQAEASSGTVTIQDVQYDYYDVSGSNLAEVIQQLDPEEWGHCRHDYEYSYDSTNGKTTTANITLKLTIRLPRWRGAGWDKASPAAKQEWQRMLEALQGHEDGHADIARRWAPIFKERLLNQQEKNVKGRYQRTLQEVNKDTKDFDDRTQHGQTQGVSLDISIQ
jgi:predicted secreted Zn-dependent protease